MVRLMEDGKMMGDITTQSAQKVWKEYTQQYKTLPRLLCHVAKENRGEGYFADVEDNSLSLEVQTPFAAKAAAHRLAIGALSGHLAEFTGESFPTFDLRVFWLKSCPLVSLTSHMFLSLPEVFLQVKQSKTLDACVETLCERLIQMGYNSLILGGWNIQSPSFEVQGELDLSYLFQKVRQKGLKLIVKPVVRLEETHSSVESFCPDRYEKQLKQAFEEFFSSVPQVDCIFWESQFSTELVTEFEDLKEQTFFERVSWEAKVVEKALGEKVHLLYHLPTPNQTVARDQAYCFETLCDELGRKTLLSFSSVAGKPHKDYLPLHPVWERLRASPDTSSTPIIPILNGGAIGMGEGLWPVLPFDQLESCFAHMHRHPFRGAVVLASEIPKRGTFLDCSLWVAGQMLWNQKSPYLLAKTWFLANRLWIGDFWDEGALRKLREVAVRVQRLLCSGEQESSIYYSKEIFRMEAQGLIADLNSMRMMYSDREKISSEEEGEFPSFCDYLRYFIRDAKRMILHALQQKNITLPNVLDGEDLYPGFWTSVEQGPQKGIGGQVKVKVLEEPSVDREDKVMGCIFSENHQLLCQIGDSVKAEK